MILHLNSFFFYNSIILYTFDEGNYHFSHLETFFSLEKVFHFWTFFSLSELFLMKVTIIFFIVRKPCRKFAIFLRIHVLYDCDPDRPKA